jgi:hypothetical protein
VLRRGLAGHTWTPLLATGGFGFSKAGGNSPAMWAVERSWPRIAFKRLLTKCLLRDAYYPSRNLFILNTDFLAISRAGRV